MRLCTHRKRSGRMSSGLWIRLYPPRPPGEWAWIGSHRKMIMVYRRPVCPCFSFFNEHGLLL